MMGDAAVVEYDYTIKRIVDARSAADLPEGIEGESTTSHYIDVVAKDDTGAWKIRLHSWSMTLRRFDQHKWSRPHRRFSRSGAEFARQLAARGAAWCSSHDVKSACVSWQTGSLKNSA